MIEHVHLLVQYDDEGKPLREPVHAEYMDNGHYRLLYSPGFVEGIGAGDEFRVLNEYGEFEVIRRGGNVVVQVYSNTDVEPYKDDLTGKVDAIGGWLDGSIDRGMVFTIPSSVGFETIESIFNDFLSVTPGIEWVYGNVYDPKDGTTPLGWWEN